MKKENLVITSYGVATAIGCTGNSLFLNMKEGKTNFQQHKQIEESERISKVAYVDDEKLIEGINIRNARKLDRFTLLALQAFRQIHQNSEIVAEDMADFGILVGNSTGGWCFVESQMDDIYRGNFDNLSPYVATAWFPTAPQGEISIQYKLSGYSKTFAADALSTGYALEHALYLIKSGYLPGAIVGGMESPLSTLVYNGCVRTEPLSSSGYYRPFHEKSDGYLLGEGAGLLMIESSDHVKARKGSSIALIGGIGVASTLSDAIKQCLADAKKKPSEVDCILLDAKGHLNLDTEEYQTLEDVFNSCRDVYLTTTKTLHGSLLAADFAVQLVVGVLTLIHQHIPRGLWSHHHHKNPSFGRLVLDHPIDTSVNNVLLYSRNLDGSSICVLIERPSCLS